MFNLFKNSYPSPSARPQGLETGYFGERSIPGWWWFHSVSQSLSNVLVRAGVTPDPDNLNTLADAIVAIARSNAIAGSLKPVRVVDEVGVALAGTPVIKGVQLVDGDRVLRNVGKSAQNGLWRVNANGSWTRPADYSTGTVIPEGIMVDCSEGSDTANTIWLLEAVPGDGATVDTTQVRFINATAGIMATLTNYLTKTEAGNTYLTKTDADTIFVRESALNAALGSYLTKTDASNTYLSKADAANTYASQQTVSGIATDVGGIKTVLNSGSPRFDKIAIGTSFDFPQGAGEGFGYAKRDWLAGYSDITLKDVVTVLGDDPSRDWLDGLDVFTYLPNKEAVEMGFSHPELIGVSAQAAQKLHPSLVEELSKEGRKFLTLRETKLIYPVIHELKKTKQEVASLTEQVAALAEEVRQLRQVR